MVTCCSFSADATILATGKRICQSKSMVGGVFFEKLKPIVSYRS